MYFIAYTVQLTLYIVTAFSIIDAIAVADVEAVLRAVFPDRPLHKAWKGLRVGAVEFSRIDPLRDRCDDLGAAAGPVAGRAIGMAGIEPVQNAGAMQEIVHKSVDRDHAGPDLGPGASQRDTEKQARQRHHQHLVGDAVDFLQWGKDRHPHCGKPAQSCGLAGSLQVPVDPAREITIGDIANEQVEGKGRLIEPAIAQPILGQRALRQVLGLGAGVMLLAISAATTVRLTPRRVLERTDLAGACCRKWAVSI